MPKLRALRPLTGNYGAVQPGQIFETTKEIADHLESMGVAEEFSDDPPWEPDPAEVQSHIKKKMLEGAPENKDRGSSPEVKGKKK